MRSMRGTVSLACLALVTLACAPPAATPSAAGAGRPPAAAEPPAASPTVSGASVSAGPPPSESIRIAYSTTSLSFVSLFVAQDRGYYQQNGLETELVQATPQVAQAGMVNGDITFGMAFGSQVRSAARGLPVRVVEESVTAPLLSMVARPEIQTIGDLRGRVIAVTTVGGNNSQTTTLLLRKHGVDPQSLQYVAAGDSPKQMELLRQGQADAALVSPPWPYIGRREGMNVLANALDEIELAFTGLGTSLDTLARRPELVRRTIRAEIQALRHMRAEREDTLRVFVDRFAMEPELAAQAYDMIIGAHTTDGAISRAGVENLLAIEKEEGAIPEHVGFDDVAELGPLTEVQRAMGLAP
jgi:NitT/TauT family transport system substrate-binding protein